MAALEERTRREPVGPRADVLTGNATDARHLDRIVHQFGRGSLVMVYLDPARPQDMTWRTVESLATQLSNVDLIINLPVNSLQRAISGPYARDAEARVAAAFLGHPDPRELMRWDRTRSHHVGGTIQAIRDYFDQQLRTLGFLQPGRRVVEYPAGVPYYDVLYASRHRLGVQLWDRANPPELPQPSLLDTLL